MTMFKYECENKAIRHKFRENLPYLSDSRHALPLRAVRNRHVAAAQELQSGQAIDPGHRTDPEFQLGSAPCRTLHAVSNGLLSFIMLLLSLITRERAAKVRRRSGRGRRKLLMRSPQVRRTQRREPRQLVCRIASFCQ